MTAEDALEALAKSDPAALRLAQVASLAVELEPALLRRLRRTLVPEASPLAEALLWSSPLASTSTPSALLLRDDILTALRERLGEDQDRLDAARAVVEASHQGSPEILRCEEELVYLGLVDVERRPRAGFDRSALAERVRARLGQVMRSILVEPERRESLLAWSSRALPSLPSRIRASDAYATLTVLAAADGHVSEADGTAVIPPDAPVGSVGVRWTTRGLVFSTEDESSAQLLMCFLPVSLVEVEFLDGDRRGEVTRVVVPPEGRVTVALSADVRSVRVRPLEGTPVVLRRPQRDEPGRVPFIPSFRNVWVLVAGTAQYELPPAEAQAAEQLGAALARNGCGLITGAFHGVDHVVSRAFGERLASLSGDASEELIRQRLLRVVQRGRTPSFSLGALHQVDDIDEEYWGAVIRATAVVVMGRAAGTHEVARTAGLAGLPVLAYPGTGAESLPGAVVAGALEPLTQDSLADGLVQTILRHAAKPSAMSHWAGESLMALAFRYLRPQPLSVSVAIAHQLLESIHLRTRQRGTPFLETAFLSPRPPERVVAYLAAQRSPKGRYLHPLWKALHLELTTTARLYAETRPLIQGLRALERVFTETPVRGEVTAVAVGEELRNALMELEALRHLDVGGECKELLQRLISVAGRTELDELASRYEELRHRYQGGAERTKLMSLLISDVQREAVRMAVTGSVIKRMYAMRRLGYRVVALGCCIARPEEAPMSVIVDALSAPKTAYEQWVALQAAEAVIDALDSHRAAACAFATFRALDDLDNVIHDRDDASRRRLAERVLAHYAARAGLPEGLKSEDLRLWFSGGGRHRKKRRPCVAVLGSSNFRARFSLGEALGERLAADGWHLVIGRGQDVGRAVVAGFRRLRETDYTVFTTSHETTEGKAEKTLVFPDHTEARREMISRATCCLVLGGARGTLEECEIAERARVPILAVTHTGGAASTVTESTRRTLRETLGLPEWLLRQMDVSGTDADAAERIVRVLNIIARRLEAHPPSPPGHVTSSETRTPNATKSRKPSERASPTSKKPRATKKAAAAKKGTASKNSSRSKATDKPGAAKARKTPPMKGKKP